MKRVFSPSVAIFAVATSISLVAVFFASCSMGGDSVSPSSSQDSWNGRIATWKPNPAKTNPAQSDYLYELPGDVRTLLVDVTNSTPLDIHIVKMNLSGSVVPAHQVQYIVKAAYSEKSSADLLANAPARSANDTDFFHAKECIDTEANADYTKMFDGLGNVPIHIDYAPARDFVPETLHLAATGRAASDIPMYNSSSPSNQIAGNVDVATLNLYVDSSQNTKPATLRYVGTNCYVWVLDDYFTNETGTRTDDKVTSAQAESVGKKFDEIYPYITNVFGGESNQIYDVVNNSAEKTDMVSKSPTGTKVNIVLYDIDGDYYSEQKSLTLGYFWAKDYYTRNYANHTSSSSAIRLTNEGKYFYIDSYALNKFEKETYSTLAHEFQHMVHFNQKEMTHDKKSNTWYNEMLSMLCEDMLQSKLNNKDEDSPKSRIPRFCSEYYLSGVTDWLSGNELASYAGAYMFGAYLARNYGGADLVKEMSTNQYVDFASVTNATGKSLSEIFKGYAEALVFLNTPSNLPKGVKTFNKDAATTLSRDSYNYPMTAINLQKYSLNGETTPRRFGNGAGSRVSLRPYGFSLHTFYSTKPYTTAKTFIFDFSSPVNSNAKVYMLVEKCNHASHIVN